MGSVSSRLALGLSALFACSAIVAPAQAAWTLDNSNGGNGEFQIVDPSENPFGAYPWVMIGSDLEGDDDVDTLTTITDVALADGPLTFSYFYFTADESPFFDPAGYFINGQQFQLTHDCGCSPFEYDTIVLDLHAGDTFGFYINSIDNVGGPAFLLLASGEVSPGFLSAPEPASWAMMVGGFGLVGGALRTRRRISVSFA